MARVMKKVSKANNSNLTSTPTERHAVITRTVTAIIKALSIKYNEETPPFSESDYLTDVQLTAQNMPPEINLTINNYQSIGNITNSYVEGDMFKCVQKLENANNNVAIGRDANGSEIHIISYPINGEKI